MLKWIKILGILCTVIVITGCWDQVESEERGYVIGVAIDALEPEKLDDIEETDDEGIPYFQGNKKFKATYQFVVTSALQGNSKSDEQGGGDAYLNVTSTGNTMFSITRDMAKKVSRAPYLEHIKVIVISEELAQKGYFPKILDLFLRDPEMRRGAKVFICMGEANKPFETISKIEKLPVMYIDSISENAYKSAEMLPKTHIGNVHAFLLGTDSFSIPTVFTTENEVFIKGSAVFQGHRQKMVGYLNEDETKGLNFIKGDIKGGVLEFPFKDQPVAFEIKGAKRKIHADISNKQQMSFKIKIEAEGNVGEVFEGHELLNEKLLSNIKDQAEKEIERLIYNVIEKTQNEFNVDVLGIGSYLADNHYKKWKNLKDNWDQGDNYFAKSDIQVQVDVKIRNIGVNIQSNQ